MSLKTAKRILTKMAIDAGKEGMALASALLRGYAGIGRGVKGSDCIAYLADETLNGTIKIEKGCWVYMDAEGTRRTGGGIGDKVLIGIAQIAVELHNHAGKADLDVYEIFERLLSTPLRVTNELESRKSMSTEKGTIRASRI